jgi:RES domain-containing protein
VPTRERSDHPPATLWRVGSDTPAYSADDVSGKGPELTGGRWNRKGTPVVYAATSRALACLETLVHLGAMDLPLNRYLVRIDLPVATWKGRTVFDPASHVGWDSEPPGMVSLEWGTDWATGLGTCLAEVPSVIVPEESNILINPRHPDARLATAIKVRKWTYDARLRVAELFAKQK